MVPLSLFLSLSATPAYADLDVVFVLDTTGSMSSEIREAKETVRGLAATLSAQRSNETVRLGVVAYRDRGDAYLTQLHPLTADIDATFAALASLSAGGGGDSPEDLHSGLRVALQESGWSQGAEKQVFVIGDAPAHAYTNEPGAAALAREARERGIVVHTIGCRSLSASGREAFRTLAYATEGTYQHIGRVSAGDPSLADAMLEALAADDVEPPSSPLALHRSGEDALSGQAPLEERTLLARYGDWWARDEGDPGDPDRACLLSVQLPSGTRLRRDPTARVSERALDLTVDLVRGDGGLVSYELASCVDPSLPIRLHLEE